MPSLYSKLWQRMGEIGDDVGKLIAAVNSVRLTYHTDGTSLYRTGRDANAVFTTLTYLRGDGSTAKTSVLDTPDVNNRYTRRVDTYYATNGTSVLAIRTYTIGYNASGEMISEILT